MALRLRRRPKVCVDVHAVNQPPVAVVRPELNEDETLVVAAPGALTSATIRSDDSLTAVLVSGPATDLTLNSDVVQLHAGVELSNGTRQFLVRPRRRQDGSSRSR